jgi:hypothetical protein
MISKPGDRTTFAPPDATGQRYVTQIAAIRRLASQLAHSGAPDELARVLVEELQRTLGAAWVALYRADPAGSFSRRAVAGDGAVRLPPTISGADAVTLRRPITPLEERVVSSDALTVFGGASIATALEDTESRLGWLVSGSRLDGTPYDRMDADLIALMCDIAVPRLAVAEFDAQFARAALTDQLTGLGNRRAFNERPERPSRCSSSTSIALPPSTPRTGATPATGRSAALREPCDHRSASPTRPFATAADSSHCSFPAPRRSARSWLPSAFATPCRPSSRPTFRRRSA